MKLTLQKFVCISLVLSMFTASIPRNTAIAETYNTNDIIEMKYDDRYNSEDTITILDAGTPISYKCGTSSTDEAVIKLNEDSKQLIASGIGQAKISINKKEYTVTVTPAPISMFAILGQSNGEGYWGDNNHSIANADGQVYSSFGGAMLNIWNYNKYIPETLTESFRSGERALNALTESGTGKMGMDSAIAYKWHKLTGEKVWIINAAHSGSAIDSWQPGIKETDNNYWQAVNAIKAAQNTLKNEIAAGHYTFSHMGYYWFQGCSDADNSAEYYVGQYRNMHSGLNKELAFDFNGDGDKEALEFGGIVLVRAAVGNRDYTGLAMNGPRRAQYYMGNSPEPDFKNVYVICNLGDTFVKSKDGYDSVKNYFDKKYGDKIDYPIQVGEMPKPTSVNDTLVLDGGLHYGQAAHNELGFECAENTYYLLYPEKRPPAAAAPEVKIYQKDGFTEAETTTGIGISKLLIPVVYPLYMSKDLNVTAEGNVIGSYYSYDFNGSGNVTAAIKNGNKACVYSGEFPDLIYENLNTAYDRKSTVSIKTTAMANNVKYQWYACDPDGNNPITIPDAISDSYKVSQNGWYYCEVKADNFNPVKSNITYISDVGSAYTGNSSACTHKWKKDMTGGIIGHWYECTLCGAYKDLGRHTFTHIEATSPSVLHDGNIEHYICSGCDSCYKDASGLTPVDDIIIPAISGVPEYMFILKGTAALLPTVNINLEDKKSEKWEKESADGWKAITCNNIDASSAGAARYRYTIAYGGNKIYTAYLITVISETNSGSCGESEHQYSAAVTAKESTCAEEGERASFCPKCGNRKIEKTPALGHSFNNYISDNNATYDKDGTKTSKCDRCDITNTTTDEGSRLVKTSSTTNEDGSITTTATNEATGTVTEITENINGSVATVIAEKDGTQKISITVPDTDRTFFVRIPMKNLDSSFVPVNIKTDEVIKMSVITQNYIIIAADDNIDIKLVNHENNFTDILNHWAEDDINFAADHKLFNGMSDTEFCPDNLMTRGMIMTVLARLDNQNTTPSDGEQWFTKGVEWAKNSGVSDGTNQDMPITREQIVTMLYRYAQNKNYNVKTEGDSDYNRFNDASKVSEYAIPAIKWAVSSQIIRGTTENDINPGENATRAELAAIMKRFIEYIVK